MTLDQALAFGLMAVTIGLFIWGRLPYDLVALLALLAGVLIEAVRRLGRLPLLSPLTADTLQAAFRDSFRREDFNP